MRSVSATRKPYRESARVAVNRRTGAHALADRPASGKRKTLRNDSISRLAPTLKSALSPRRPVTLLSVSVMVAAAFCRTASIVTSICNFVPGFECAVSTLASAIIFFNIGDQVVEVAFPTCRLPA